MMLLTLFYRLVITILVNITFYSKDRASIRYT